MEALKSALLISANNGFFRSFFSALCVLTFLLVQKSKQKSTFKAEPLGGFRLKNPPPPTHYKARYGVRMRVDTFALAVLMSADMKIYGR